MGKLGGDVQTGESFFVCDTGEKEARRSEALFLADSTLGVDGSTFDRVGDHTLLGSRVKSMVLRQPPSYGLIGNIW